MGTNYSEIWIKTKRFSCKKINLEIMSTKSRPVCSGINSVWPSDTIWWQVWVSIGSGNGLLPDGTKPLPEPMLTNDQLDAAAQPSITKIVFQKLLKEHWVNMLMISVSRQVQQSHPVTRRASSASSKSGSVNSAGTAPTTKPPTPPQAGRAGTLPRQTSSPYRSPAPPVSPPSVPSHYAPGYITQQQRNMVELEKRSQYAPIGNLGNVQVSRGGN